jgi:hypothetical protein
LEVAQTAAPYQVEPYRGVHFQSSTGVRRRRPETSGWRGVTGVVVVSALVTVFSWRSLAWRPALAGLDSWQAGITLGFLDHRQWGPQIIFTFGPYGFVEDILPFSHLTAALGWVYALVVVWGLAALIVGAVRPAWGLLPAGVAAWAALAIAANMVEAPELGTALALGLALASFRVAGRRQRLVLLVLLGAFAGLQFLVEIDVGLVCALLAVLAVAGHDGRREALVSAGGTFVAVVVVALAAAGQSLANLPSYVHGSLSVLLGYASAMSISDGREMEDWFALVDIALLATVFALAERGRPWAEKVVISLALVAWTWEAVKEGFVRHDKHDLIFFALVLVAMCVARLPGRALLQAGAIVASAVLALLANGWAPRPMTSPIEDVRAIAQEVQDLAVPGRWPAVERGARAQVRASGDTLPPALLASLGGRTLAAVPMEDALTFAYPALRWDPVPVLQGYSAYTGYLDQLDAGFLASAGAPQRILYRPGTIDGRDPVWDPPAAMEAMYCHYLPLGQAGGWLVLSRVVDRCGAAHPIGTVTDHFGQVVDVPRAPGTMVVATFSLASPLSAQLEGVLLKPPMVSVVADGTPYRFVTGTAGDDHVLSAPPALGYPTAYAPGAVHRLELTGGGWAAGHGSATITFFSVPVNRH